MRLFVAVLISDAELARIDEALAPIRKLGLDVRWIPAGSIHLTLMFLGEVAEPRVPQVRDTITTAAAQHVPFDVVLGGFGAFPNPRRSRVWWVGMQATPQLLALQKDVETGLGAMGFRTENRPYAPHLTVARAMPNARPLPAAQADQIVQRFHYHGQLHVDCVDLMRSHLQRGGAKYESIATCALSGGEKTTITGN
jgi:2'-5' RNA ligase